MNLYSMKIKEQTRKLAAGCSKHSFEVVDKTDEVSDHIYGKATLTWFEEIFEEYYFLNFSTLSYIGDKEI
ncbi:MULTISPECIES: hypothetical protein [Streptococcus]|uniref:hypothetical protein n=2 Tax=Streptococcus TaxID=1301 RepID=UPI000A65C45A|nr:MULTISPECIES: hypothetical protein [Streptococcus]